MARTWVTRVVAVFGVVCLAIDLTFHHHIGPIMWAVASYLFLAFLALTDFTVLPKRDGAFCQTLTDEEFRLFQAYHVSLVHPAAADTYAAILNALAMIGVVFGVMALVGQGWVTGALLLVFFFIANAYQMRLAPMAQTNKLAAKGDPVAVWRTKIMASIVSKQVAWKVRNDSAP